MIMFILKTPQLPIRSVQQTDLNSKNVNSVIYNTYLSAEPSQFKHFLYERARLSEKNEIDSRGRVGSG